MKYGPITDEQTAALRDYAKEHGRFWKAQLNLDWLDARASPPLQQLRNSHGPSWLADYKLPKED